MRILCLMMLTLTVVVPTHSEAKDSQPRDAANTTICDVVAHPKTFDGQRIRVPAEVIATMEGRVLSDPNCKLGFELWYSRTPESSPDIAALDNAIYRDGCIGTIWKQIHANFSGTFVWQRKKKRGKYALKLDRVEDLDVKRQPSPCDARQPSPPHS